MKVFFFTLILFIIGMFGLFVTRKNIIIILMSLELMLLALNLNLVVSSLYLDDLYGEIFALFVLTVAAAESAIGLALLVAYYRLKGTVGTLFINALKG